ncbi:RNA-binding domain-containing [Lecanosticta acicola]|uniref:RNA-binding domain-containing n=1 Tax=Lecanosticta acicola TaxID=111012 RepID=A0AAI8Z313_9PEZI|nr:RNA-binding domain-containing [Lecanosticta acicola]
MFALRRAAARAVFTQPVRQLSTLRQTQSRASTLQLEKPTLYRSLHQSLRWRAEEERKPAEQAEASPAEAETSGETVTTEPSTEEQKEIREKSVAEPTIVESVKETAESVREQAQEKAQEAAEGTQSTASNVAEKAQEAVSGAAQSIQNAASQVAQQARDRFPPRDALNPGSPESGKILYVGNLFFEVTTSQLESEFARFGQITNVRIVTDSRGMSKGFGYVEFSSQESAARAAQELNQATFQGRRMAVQFHVRREPRAGTSNRPISPPSKTLFIGNMSYQMSDRDLNDLFREIRNVLDVRVAIDRRSGQPRGFAHADFIDISSAEKAKEILSQKVIYGRQLKVDFSQSSTVVRDRDSR